MAYVSLYRKWRPQTFDEVIGQEYVTRTLSNSLRSGNYAHAYLFSGPRGTGKTSTARILAKALNCEEGPTPHPCNHCASCREITEGTSVDIVEIDAASNRGIDDIRDLRERVIFSPAAARIKVYILDEAHMLTPPAFNALLKMLEEPPSHVVFVLATTEPHKMPATILSRCQRFDFRSVPVSYLAEHLEHIAREEKIEASGEALRLIARRARGSARDALVILEQVISYGDGKVNEAEVAGFLGLAEDEMLVQLGDCLAAENTAGAISLVERAYEEGWDLIQFAREAQEHFRRVFLLQYADLNAEELEVDEGTYTHIRRQADALRPNRTFHFISALREAVREMQGTTSTRLTLESALIGMARSELDSSPEALAERIDGLEAEVERWMRKGGGDLSQPARSPAQPVRSKRKEQPAPEEDISQEIETESHGEIRVEEETGAAQLETEAKAAVGTRGRTAAVLDLAAVRRAWPQVKESVKERKITTHAFLLEGKPLQLEGDKLTIVFPPDRAFHRGEMEKEDHRRVLEEALGEVLGVDLRVETRLEEEEHRSTTGEIAEEERESKCERIVGEHEFAGEDGEEPLLGEGGNQEKESCDTAAEIEPETKEDTAAGLQGKPEKKADAGAVPEASGVNEAGTVKLVKDIFGAEMIEEIKLKE